MTIRNTQQKVGEKFNENFKNIFGDGKPKRGSFVQSADGKLVPRNEYERPESVKAPMIMGPLKEFKSPIDGTVISSRKQLAAHNKEHGVTNSADYSNGYIEKRALARNEAGAKHLQETRRTDINEAIERHQ